MLSAAAHSPAFNSAAAGPLAALLDISLTALGLLRPLYAEAGAVEGAPPVDFAFEYLNPAGQRLLGLAGPPASFLGCFPGARDNGTLAFYCRVFATGEAGEFTGNYLADDLDSYFRVVARREGELLAVSFTGTDSNSDADPADQGHRAAEAEEALRTSQGREAAALAAARQQVQERETLYGIFEQTPAPIAVLREPSHTIRYCNPAYERLFSGCEVRGRTIAEVSPEAVAQGFVALLDGVYQTGKTHFGVETPFVVEQPVGPPRTSYFNFTYQAYREDGQTAGISVFAYDVTEQVLARQEHEAQQQQQQELFMQAPAPIVILDGPELVFQLVNPAYQLIFPGRDLVNKPLLEALPELVGTHIPALLSQVYQTGEPVVAHEMPLMMARRQGGPLEEIYWTFTCQARRNAQGLIDGVRVFAHDVTEQLLTRQAALVGAQQAQALAAELTTANQQLTRTNADLDSFVYTASHDLKQPIANIEGLLMALREHLPHTAYQPAGQPDDALLPTLLRLMQGAVERFKLTISQLTDVSRLQQAHTEPAEPVELATLVDDLRLDLAPLLVGADTQLTIDVAACPEVSFAPRHLRSIVYNLLSNAIKYREPARPLVVHLRCRSTAEQVILDVQDNGLGLTAAQQNRLFGMFQRLHDHVEGSGIGLFMVKKIVENAGGVITVVSEAGVGSTFTVTLPLSPEKLSE